MSSPVNSAKQTGPQLYRGVDNGSFHDLVPGHKGFSFWVDRRYSSSGDWVSSSEGKIRQAAPPKKVKHNYRPRGMFKADPGQPALGSSVSSFYLGVGHSFDLFLICILISSCRTGLWKELRRRVGGVSWECVCVCVWTSKCEPLLGATGLKMHIGVRRNLCVFFCFLFWVGSSVWCSRGNVQSQSVSFQHNSPLKFGVRVFG